uniref:Guanine nucleotide-binding protein subunit gamma n=1 Tax=Hucho hucho TaxID=62062 RepID=A0A4W5KGR2_9TELE
GWGITPVHCFIFRVRVGVSHLFIAISLVSKAAADLMAYCDAHIREDPLIVPVPASENPFREKKLFCTIL